MILFMSRKSIETPPTGADPNDVLHVLGALRVDDGVGWLIGNPCNGVAMLLTHRLRRDNAIAEGRS
jgi:hypothetical protein